MHPDRWSPDSNYANVGMRGHWVERRLHRLNSNGTAQLNGMSSACKEVALLLIQHDRLQAVEVIDVIWLSSVDCTDCIDSGVSAGREVPMHWDSASSPPSGGGCWSWTGCDGEGIVECITVAVSD